MAGLRAFFGIVFALITVTAFGQESRKAGESKKPDDQVDAPVVVFRGHHSEVTSLAFSGDGKQVVSASAKAVCVWEPTTGKEIRRLKIDDRSTVGVNRDLSRLAVGAAVLFWSTGGVAEWKGNASGYSQRE